MFRRLLLRVVNWAGPLVLAGCMSAPVPMRTEYFPARGAAQADDLYIFFPGRRDDVSDFGGVGYARVLGERLPAAAAVSLDARMGYYRNRSLVERVKLDALERYDAGAYRRVYLVGLSLGGLGAILSGYEFPEQVDGILLISPFLGYDGILDEIERAGGVGAWSPGEVTARDWQRVVWSQLKEYLAQDGELPPITLAYGRDDYLVKGHRLLAAALPDDRVISVPGEHTNPVFLKLWSKLLERQ